MYNSTDPNPNPVAREMAAGGPNAFACPHDHNFFSDQQQANERRTWWVIMLTVSTMVLEIISGLIFGSMSLLADGWHMASHASAMAIIITMVIMITTTICGRPISMCWPTP
ncbi:hypothetical protein [uncultured Desulfosarcina sp.]|uniref:hypothetical protein n=1 Tax=uncultured Desulfosarcina sp. TaxID=218289 RepID=UPI0029C94EBC|nr:hypothetical protein [uncultured Desulfosarcina sp.]